MNKFEKRFDWKLPPFFPRLSYVLNSLPTGIIKEYSSPELIFINDFFNFKGSTRAIVNS